ncbi:FAD-dependent oxidoreductase [Gordonia sp. 'Campus']|uniref:NAD(P)/FAD-dependent oxidoreductase n=1 Tax=Gordonia sp. 'Campus' TaxID=2915824 RepID=UPI001EE43D9E|nr:FAD-dependent oxidoreductase [Gordonia sp. 'Campus']
MTASPTGMPAAASVVIVGTGVAGITAAESLRTNGFDGAIIVFGEEPHLPYRRTALSKGIVDGDLSDAGITLRPPAYWTDRGIDIVTSTRVVDVDPRARRVRLADESDVAYDALVLATGGRARRLPGATSALTSLRSRADVDRIRAALDEGPVVIVGGGLIGTEIAAAIASAGDGTRVSIVEAAPSLLSRVVPAVIADDLISLHREHGVHIHTSAQIASADAGGVTLADGTRLAGTVISAIGMEPEVALAESAGLALDRAGILVDDALRTSMSGIYAAGDVAARPHPLTGAPMRAEQWLTATEHGRLVAMTISTDLGSASSGTPAPRVPLAWTMQYGTNVQIVGWPAAGARVVLDADGSCTTARCFDEDRLVGAVCMGRGGPARQIRDEIEATLRPVGIGA